MSAVGTRLTEAGQQATVVVASTVTRVDCKLFPEVLTVIYYCSWQEQTALHKEYHAELLALLMLRQCIEAACKHLCLQSRGAILAGAHMRNHLLPCCVPR